MKKLLPALYFMFSAAACFAQVGAAVPVPVKTDSLALKNDSIQVKNAAVLAKSAEEESLILLLTDEETKLIINKPLLYGEEEDVVAMVITDEATLNALRAEQARQKKAEDLQLSIAVLAQELNNMQSSGENAGQRDIFAYEKFLLLQQELFKEQEFMPEILDMNINNWKELDGSNLEVFVNSQDNAAEKSPLQNLAGKGGFSKVFIGRVAGKKSNKSGGKTTAIPITEDKNILVFLGVLNPGVNNGERSKGAMRGNGGERSKRAYGGIGIVVNKNISINFGYYQKIKLPGEPERRGRGGHGGADNGPQFRVDGVIKFSAAPAKKTKKANPAITGRE